MVYRIDSIHELPQEILRRNPKLLELSGEPQPKENKYHAKKVTVDGITYDSTKEANRFQQLLLMQAAFQTQ